MDAIASHDEQEIRSQLARARERLECLVRDLRAIDQELDGLSAERKQHCLVANACDALEELSALGAARLFWGDGSGGGRDEQVRLARSRVDAFEKLFGEIEERRQALLEQILLQQEGTELLEGDVLDLEREAQERELEWIVEREASGVPTRPATMPWTRGGEDDARFRKNLAASLLLSLVFGLAAPHIDLPLPEPWTPDEAPKRLTRLIQTPRPMQREPRPDEVKPEPAKETPLVAEAKPTPAPTAQKEGPGTGSAVGPASGPKGILAFREKLSGVTARDPSARLGLQARISGAGEAASGRVERSLVTTQAPGSSGGVNLASLSRGGGGGSGGQQLAAVEVARATSTIGGGGGGGGGSGGAGGSALSGGAALGRTDEEIQIVFDRHKAALYRLYNRELRSDPTLKGQIVLRIKIEPDGSVSLCALQATDMQAPQLAAQVVERVRAFDFGAKEGIAAVTILYPIDFLPAT